MKCGEASGGAPQCEDFGGGEAVGASIGNRRSLPHAIMMGTRPHPPHVALTLRPPGREWKCEIKGVSLRMSLLKRKLSCLNTTFFSKKYNLPI